MVAEVVAQLKSMKVELDKTKKELTKAEKKGEK